MESSPDPSDQLLSSSSLPRTPIDQSEVGNKTSSPILPTFNHTALDTYSTPFEFDWEPSSDPIAGSITPIQNNIASSHRLSRNPIRKRGPSVFLSEPPTKEPRTTEPTQSHDAKELVLQARDLLVQAYSLTNSRNQQARLLDLVEIFREFTEFGRVRHTSSILATQVANLEKATRKIEIQAKVPISQVGVKPTFSEVALPNPAKPENWTLVSSNKGNRTKTSNGTSSKETTSMSTSSGKSKLALSRRCTLLQARNVQASSFSSIQLRNAINSAFNKKGIQGLVISTVALSLRGNITVTTTPEFNVDFLIENEEVIKGVLPLITSIKRGEPWYKVAIHGIPIREFDTNEGLDSDLVANEIRTFNKGLTPIGRSFWTTSKSKRDSGLIQSGTIIVAFPTEDQAKRAINNRLYIAGVSAKVAKYIATSRTTQCNKCAGFGHSELLCKREPKCIFCAENHISKQHYCNICNKTGLKCKHTSVKCTNCKDTTHSADSKLCEVYLAIKNKATTTSININES
jgi:hypothetical protein